jgi:hypothetical protein
MKWYLPQAAAFPKGKVNLMPPLQQAFSRRRSYRISSANWRKETGAWLHFAQESL